MHVFGSSLDELHGVGRLFACFPLRRIHAEEQQGRYEPCPHRQGEVLHLLMIADKPLSYTSGQQPLVEL